MRLIIVSNRLPITIKSQNNILCFEGSSGGLSSGLNSFLNSPTQTLVSKQNSLWVGWPGKTPASHQEYVREYLTEYQNAYPVFLNDKEEKNYYLGFCNEVIWPLFHKFSNFIVYKENYWEEYKKVNEKFCDELLQILKPGDLVWVHDYHLMLLPKMLKEVLPDLSVGFFLHIPFPNIGAFRMLPLDVQIELLEGILGANSVGFQTKGDTGNFLNCVEKILGHTGFEGVIKQPTHTSSVGTFPISVNHEDFAATALDEETQKIKAHLKQKYKRQKVILSMDRLDYTKAIPQRLVGFEALLQENPDLLGKVVLNLIVVPSRVEVAQYANTKILIEGLVADINQKFGNKNWQPIDYQFKNLPFKEIVANFLVSDIALVTPFQDGMNLVAKEYVASKIDQTGVLILSSRAGSIKELKSAIIIDPLKITDITKALKNALNMGVSEQKLRMSLMQDQIKRHTVIEWAQSFLDTLSVPVVPADPFSSLVDPAIIISKIKEYELKN